MNGARDPICEFENVSLRYKAVVALDGVTLAIPAGARVGVIGPDGVGKSSLLALVTGARRIQRGRVRVLGGDMADARHRANICPGTAYMPRGLTAAFLPPYFNSPVAVSLKDVDHLMNTAAYTFVLIVPPNFESDVLGGRAPAVQVNVDATAMVTTGLGYGYIQQILTTEIDNFVSRTEGQFFSRSQNIPASPITLSVRVAFNPNVMTAWFTSVMDIVNNVMMLAVILAGAAVIREREHGTPDHLLIMPVTPFEIAMSKIWANGLVITAATALSLEFIVRGLLQIPIAGSAPLFIAGVALYLFFATAVVIFLATVARTMPQLGLLYILVALPMNVLSGSNTPLESMPALLRDVMMFSPSTHFVLFAQSILFRGADLTVVWPQFLFVAIAGGLFLLLSLVRFRSVTIQAG